MAPHPADAAPASRERSFRFLRLLRPRRRLRLLQLRSRRLTVRRVPPASSTTSGLVCGHHHLYSSLARGMPPPPVQPTDFLSILEQIWWRLDVALDLEMIRWSAMLGALEALECGTTAIVDHHESPHAIEGSLSVIADACAE